MKQVVRDLTSDSINIIYRTCNKPKNKKRLNELLNFVTSIAFSYLKPYIYTILGTLILLFVLNCLQFYYYIKNVSMINTE